MASGYGIGQLGHKAFSAPQKVPVFNTGLSFIKNGLGCLTGSVG